LPEATKLLHRICRERRAATPASAQAFIDTLHGLFKWAVSVNLAKNDPTLNVKVKTKSKPFNKGALGTAFVEAARVAGVRGKSAHGLRKAAATRAAENGATERELEAIFGWSGGRIATLYTKSASRSRLAAGAIGKLDRAETENRTSIPAPSAEVRAGNRKSE